MNSLHASNSVDIDLASLNYIHGSDGKTVDWLNLQDKCDLFSVSKTLTEKARSLAHQQMRVRHVA